MSAGFYKNDRGILCHAPNFVFSENFTLIKEDKDELLELNVFPIDGWYWFDTKEEAISELGVDFPSLKLPNNRR